MARWVEIKVIDDDEDFGERDAMICSNCYERFEKFGIMYEEAPINYKELNRCPVCGADIQ